MGNVYLMDCTLRDGGYINNWRFGARAIRDICSKMTRTGIEFFEVGFIKDTLYDDECSVFSRNEQIAAMISPKNPKVHYTGMVDIGDAISLDKLGYRQDNSVDGLRVIFKKNKIQEGFDYCKNAQSLGYKVFVQVVATNDYSDKELVDIIEKFNTIKPDAFSIVDTLGVIKKKDFLRMVEIADHNLLPEITLGYHSHNNLQQAFGNAEAMTELNLSRDILIDACIFGMGRGAGNLNMELFAKFLNENCGKTYHLEPMLEIIDDYLNDIYNKEFWGYSLPFYLTATNCCHPNYAKYFAEKGTLTLKGFNEILKSIPDTDKQIYGKGKAEEIYIAYQKNYIDDKGTVAHLRDLFYNRCILLLGPGKSVQHYEEKIQRYIQEKNPIVIALNFIPDGILADIVFSCHMRRYSKIQDNLEVKTIITSNVREAKRFDYMINFSSYACDKADIVDNSAIVCLKFLYSIGNEKVALAGLDGYSSDSSSNYVNSGLEYRFSDEMVQIRNELMKEELHKYEQKMDLTFITPSIYENKNRMEIQ